MFNRVRSFLIPTVFMGLLIATGCATQSEKKAMKKKFQERVDQFKYTIDQLETENENLKDKYLSLKKEKEKLTSKVDMLEGIRKSLKAKLGKFEAENEDVSFGENQQLQLKGDVLFDSGRAKLREDGKKTLKELANILKNEDVTLKIAGHTDDAKIEKSAHLWKTDTNLELGAHRALRVALFLQDQGIDPERAYIASYGQYRPRKPNNSPENKELNRRVEIWVKKKSPDELSKSVSDSKESKKKSESPQKGSSEESIPQK